MRNKHVEKWVDVRLGGYLGKQFGKHHRFLVSTPGEVIKALCMQIAGFKNALKVSESKGMTFAVFNGKHNIHENDHFSFMCKNSLTILPLYIGSKRGGILQTILGVILIVVGTYFGQAWAVQAGIGLTLGGVVQMLSPQPQALKLKQDSENSSSYAFGGPVNTTAQGNPIGVLYGKREVGGAIISAGILAEDQQ